MIVWLSNEAYKYNLNVVLTGDRSRAAFQVESAHQLPQNEHSVRQRGSRYRLRAAIRKLLQKRIPILPQISIQYRESPRLPAVKRHLKLIAKNNDIAAAKCLAVSHPEFSAGAVRATRLKTEGLRTERTKAEAGGRTAASVVRVGPNRQLRYFGAEIVLHKAGDCAERKHPHG